jgi:Ricin-type beta-trefoil lectin domain-like
MDINLNPNDNSNVILWSFSGGANQKWQFEISNNGEYTIVSLHQGLVLEISELLGAKPD